MCSQPEPGTHRLPTERLDESPVPSPEGCDPSVSAIFKKAVQVLSKSEMVTDNGSVIVFFGFVYISGKKCKVG